MGKERDISRAIFNHPVSWTAFTSVFMSLVYGPLCKHSQDCAVMNK